jgi:hypothetical protein
MSVCVCVVNKHINPTTDPERSGLFSTYLFCNELNKKFKILLISLYDWTRKEIKVLHNEQH